MVTVFTNLYLIKAISFYRHRASLHFIPFTCDFCDKEFTNEIEYLNHNNQIHGRFQCQICDKRFTRNWSLNQHIRSVHEGQKNHECNQCNKKFATSSSLRRHIKSVHQNVKNFNCDQCPKAFSRKINLVNHKIKDHNIHLVCKDCYENYVNSNSDVTFPMAITHTENCICQNS